MALWRLTRSINSVVADGYFFGRCYRKNQSNNYCNASNISSMLLNQTLCIECKSMLHDCVPIYCMLCSFLINRSFCDLFLQLHEPWQRRTSLYTSVWVWLSSSLELSPWSSSDSWGEKDEIMSCMIWLQVVSCAFFYYCYGMHESLNYKNDLHVKWHR